MEEPGSFAAEYRYLTGAKNTPVHTLSKEDLLEKYRALVTGYEALLAKAAGPGSQWAPGSPEEQPEEIRKIKERLLTQVTHEFLTPLNLIITPLEQMLPRCEDKEQKKTLSMIYRNGQRLLLVINQVLEVLKLETRKYRLTTRPHDLVLFLRGITANFERLCEEQEVELILKTPRENIPLYFDQEKLAEVMCNLVMNALRHTPPGGYARLSVRESPGGPVEISLHNTGPEIPPDQTARIFDRAFQLRERFEQYTKGLGIGLFLAKEYIKLHRGTLEVNSEPGKGTEFIIRLPGGKDHFQPHEIEESPRSPGSGDAGDRISKCYASILELEREEMKAGRESRNHSTTGDPGGQDREVVLVVEDSVDMRGFMKASLEEAGYAVVEAVDGKQGIERAREIVPDIVISDIMMPEVEGYQLCRKLKKDMATSHIPVILLSVKFQDDEIVKGLEAGADDYITKPFSMDMLLSRVKNLVNLRRRLQQKIQLEMVMHSAELDLSSLDNQFIKNIRDTIEEHLSDPGFGLDELADALFMSRTTLYRKLTSLSGQPPKKFIQAYRLKRSVELLKQNYGNVTEVAFKVGFSNSAYFTKCFKETFNRLPSEFTVN